MVNMATWKCQACLCRCGCRRLPVAICSTQLLVAVIVGHSTLNLTELSLQSGFPYYPQLVAFISLTGIMAGQCLTGIMAG